MLTKAFYLYLLFYWSIYYQLMITIFLRKITGKGEKIQIKYTDTVQQLMQEINRIFRFPAEARQDSIDVIFRGNLLNEKLNQTLDEVGIAQNSIIHVVEKQDESIDDNQLLNLKMILNGRLFEYKIQQEQLVSRLKLAVCQDLQIKEEDLTLSFLGIELDNSRTIKSYNFTQDVLLSASVPSSVIFKSSAPASKESYSEESEPIPKIIRQRDLSPRRKVKKTESMNVDTNIQNKNNNIFCSVRLNKIEQKNDESRNDSQINQSEEISEQINQVSEEMQLNLGVQADWQKPKLTLQSLSKPWYGDQKVIETESIVGDEQQQSLFTDCLLELIRQDRLRQYILECTAENTFEDVIKLLAKLEGTEQKHIKLMINLDEVSKSAISNRSSKGICNSPPAAANETLRRHRSSLDCRSHVLISQQRLQKQKMRVVQWAAKMKSRTVSIEYNLLKEI